MYNFIKFSRLLVADPGFTRCRETPNLLFWPNFPKSCMKMNKIGPRGERASLPTPWIRQCLLSGGRGPVVRARAVLVRIRKLSDFFRAAMPILVEKPFLVRKISVLSARKVGNYFQVNRSAVVTRE